MIFRLYRLVCIVVILDQVSKLIMLSWIFNPDRVIILAPMLNFTPVYNDGVSFGILQGSGLIATIALAGFAIIVGLFLPFYSKDWPRMAQFGARIMAGGALGNAVDRIRLGKVVDFIDVHLGSWHWPAFNVADCAITIGVVIIAITMCRPGAA